MFDTIIVGGGLAGLSLAEHLPNALIVETYPSWGGRVVTHRSPQYEIGAGRIFSGHTRVHALIRRFGLHTFPIPHEPNEFLSLFTPIRVYLESLDTTILANHTISELIPETLHPILKRFPYTAELSVLRADVALPLFRGDGTMGSTKSEYCGIVEGMDALITHLVHANQRHGTVMKTRHTVHNILQTNSVFEIQGTKGKSKTPFRFQGRNIVLATSVYAFSKIPIVQNLPIVKQLGTSPLLRIYAVYPPNSDGKVWFHRMSKIVTDKRLRHIIPINEDKGLIMVSYTDGEDTFFWKEHIQQNTLDHTIHKELQSMFPTKTIPAPIYLRAHNWPDGCTYWLPGNYDVNKAIQEAIQPIPNLYICGESVSNHQTWMEGALESAERILSILTKG